MKDIDNYVLSVIKLIELPRNNLYKKKYKIKKVRNLIKKYDETLLDKYKYIEKLLEEELHEN